MSSLSRLRPRGRGRELAVIVAGLSAGAALAWAGATVHDGLRTAGEVAIARLSGAVEDTVLSEWQRLLGASEPPVLPAGERFTWSAGEPPLEPLALREAHEPARLSVFEALLAEAQRRELVEGDLAGALALVVEALEKEPESPRRPEGWLRALQLAAKLGRAELAETYWEHLRALDLAEARGGIPYRVLGWLALPYERQKSERPLTPTEFGRLFVEDDRLELGPPDEPTARFVLAPMVEALTHRLWTGPMASLVQQRMVRKLAELAPLPEVADDGRWHLVELAGRPFAARDSGSATHGFFYSARALERALAERTALPHGFALDFEGADEALGVAVRARTKLADSTLAFTLRHADPAQLARAESSRLKLLRGALWALALACAAGAFLTARVLARQRRLGELKSAFIAGVSHDLRTPLASISLLAENLESGVAEGSERARYHRALSREAARLRRLVDDVLDFSRLERGEGLELRREELDLAPFVAELCDELGERVRERGRVFECVRTTLPATAALDGHALRRALLNLVDNALKHGRGAVRLAFASADGRLRVTVADEGPGVPAAARERVFAPFERLNGSAHVGGTGLGLAIVRSIARAHGGEARVRTIGAGSVFELELPLEDA